MKKTFLLLALTVAAGCLQSSAQLRTVELNKLYYQFNNGADLPAEKNFMVNTPIGTHITMVEMQISSRNLDKDRSPYSAVWEKAGQQVSVAHLVSYYKLRQNAYYNFRFLYYRDITAAEREQMEQLLVQSCYTALQSAIREKGSRYRVQSSPADIYRLLNYTLKEGLAYYAQKQQFRGDGSFSELLLLQIKSTVRQKVDAALGGLENIDALKQQVAAEIKMIANTYDYIIDEEYELLHYQAEKLNNALALNVGYGGIYRSGDLNDLSYSDAPYAGVSFSLGNRIFSSNFWNNTSLSAGVFLKNFRYSYHTEVSGPVVNLPLYAAFGYRVFNYFKINAGAAIMEERNLLTGNKRIVAQPFVGLSLEMYLWMGFNKRR